jgi:hypothetical protein
MASVSSNNLILVIPEYLEIVRGQALSGSITLHQNYVGNPLNIGTLNDLTLQIFDDKDTLIKSYNKVAGNLSYGTGSSNAQGTLNFTLTGAETLTMSKGDVHIVVTTVFPINSYVLPKLKIGRTFDSGEVMPSGALAGRFTVPAPVYSVRSFSYGSDLPALGEVVMNVTNPASVTKIIFNNQDDRGIRNTYLESALVNKFAAGVPLHITLVNTFNASLYATYEITAWQRVEILNDGQSSNAEYTDGIELTLSAISNSRTKLITLHLQLETS